VTCCLDLNLIKTLNKRFKRCVRAGFLLISSTFFCTHSKVHAAPNTFFADTNILEIEVNAGEVGLLSASLVLQSENPTLFRLQADSMSALIGTIDGMATYDFDSKTLRLPEVVIDGRVAYRDVHFGATDSFEQLFILLSAHRNTSTGSALISPSCTENILYRNTKTCSFILNGFVREFHVYLPSNYSEDNEAFPVLLSLHGGGDYAEFNMQYTNFSANAESNSFIAIFPQGYFYGDKATTGWNTEAEGVDDVIFIEKIIDWIGATHNVKRKEVYVAGFSNGGFMAYHLACNLSEKIAAIASVSGLMGHNSFETCSPYHPMPIMHIHGQRDDVIPLSGSSYFAPLEGNQVSPGVVSLWQDFNECQSFVQENLLGNGGLNVGFKSKHTSCLNDTEIIYTILSDQNHEWFGGSKADRDSFDSTKAIWNFLSKYDIRGKKRK